MQLETRISRLSQSNTKRPGLTGLKRFKTGALADNYGGVTESQPIFAPFQALLTTQILKMRTITSLVEMRKKQDKKLLKSLALAQTEFNSLKMKMCLIPGSHLVCSHSQHLTGQMLKIQILRHSSQVISSKLVEILSSSGSPEWL